MILISNINNFIIKILRMGKKGKKKEKAKKVLPFVSICTPTFNRRPFIKTMIYCFNEQTYPKELMEWIIIDDGEDKIEDLIADHPNVKYFKYDTKMTLGKKRNTMHEKSKGDILIYMDDDDYYPPCRVSHAVERLMSDKNALCAGSSEIFVYFNHIEQMYKFGPYSKNHATAGTFAFKKELLKLTKYNEEACLAEEKEFLKNYTIPFIQLDSLKTILVVSHNHNTFDKKEIIPLEDTKFAKKSSITPETFIKNEIILDFFKNIDKQLEDYPLGSKNHKPDVIKQYNEIKKKRAQDNQPSNIKMKNTGGEEKVLSNNEIVNIIHNLQEKVKLLENENKLLKMK